MIAMVAAKKKLAYPPKKVVDVAATSPKITSTTRTPADVAVAQAITILIVPHKMASIMPSSVDTIAGQR